MSIIDIFNCVSDTIVWIISWAEKQSMANLSHYFAIALFGYLFVRVWQLRRSRDYWKSLVHFNTSKEVAEVCGEQMKQIRQEVKKTLSEIKEEMTL